MLRHREKKWPAVNFRDGWHPTALWFDRHALMNPDGLLRGLRLDRLESIASEVGTAHYRIAFPQRAFATEVPEEAVEIEGAPDLVVQMLDKLVDNAVDFSPEGATIMLRVRLEPQAAVVEVDNPGPPLSAETSGHLFESLWQSRAAAPGVPADSDSRPHFGLGLYIVRLIAEFHRGAATASSLPGDSGARFTIRLAR